jgi:hypothetical protein
MENEMNVRSKKMLKGADGQSCMNCGVRDGTVVAAHYTGMRSHAFGKGTGTKPHDLLIADLCRACHAAFDGASGNLLADKIDKSEQFLYLILQTLLRRVDQGILEVP